MIVITLLPDDAHLLSSQHGNVSSSILVICPLPMFFAQLDILAFILMIRTCMMIAYPPHVPTGRCIAVIDDDTLDLYLNLWAPKLVMDQTRHIKLETYQIPSQAIQSNQIDSYLSN